MSDNGDRRHVERRGDGRQLAVTLRHVRYVQWALSAIVAILTIVQLAQQIRAGQ
ncbi:MAG TPA: hypothetical protein VJP59_00185 [Gemmatimonadota bacterium]|nr:hypothetical protein [Gemmatimonadota bacterium]